MNECRTVMYRRPLILYIAGQSGNDVLTSIGILGHRARVLLTIDRPGRVMVCLHVYRRSLILLFIL